jgi:hypothetical protein
MAHLTHLPVAGLLPSEGLKRFDTRDTLDADRDLVPRPDGLKAFSHTSSLRGTAMWDTADDSTERHPSYPAHLSHDLPCPRCGHGAHTYLPCGDLCACPPTAMPGAFSLAA